ncbi:MAG: Gfo/Idh/MocA family protein [Phycisphaerae bacterium]
MKKVRFGIVGLGAVGRQHAAAMASADSSRLEFSAVACAIPENAHAAAEEYGVEHFHDAQELFDSGCVDAVLIATPHYWHPPLAIRAARAGVHVLCEKPLAVTVGAARAMAAECRKRNVALGVMFQQRHRPVMQTMRRMIDEGQLGEVFRVEMICSGWIRTQAYYTSGAWRGTWNGEGGGVLMNQAPHSLDLFLWLGGVPREVFGFCETRTHRIEVENTAEIICRYEGPRTGHIYVSTAHAPGGERLILAGDRGTLVADGDRLRFGKLAGPLGEHILTCPRAGSEEGAIDSTWEQVAVDPSASADELRMAVVEAFAEHLRSGAPMTASAEDGLNQTELTSAVYLSADRGVSAHLPVDADAIDNLLQQRAQASAGDGPNLRSDALADLENLLSQG